jgi:hypothetical protein
MPGNARIWGIYVSEDLNPHGGEISPVRGYSPNKSNKDRPALPRIPRRVRYLARYLAYTRPCGMYGHLLPHPWLQRPRYPAAGLRGQAAMPFRKGCAAAPARPGDVIGRGLGSTGGFAGGSAGTGGAVSARWCRRAVRRRRVAMDRSRPSIRLARGIPLRVMPTAAASARVSLLIDVRGPRRAACLLSRLVLTRNWGPCGRAAAVGGVLCRRLGRPVAARGGTRGRGAGISRPALSGGLRGGDGDDAAGVEFLQLPQQVFLAGLGGLAAGVEIGAGFLVRLAGLEDGVGDLEESMRDRDDGSRREALPGPKDPPTL